MTTVWRNTLALLLFTAAAPAFSQAYPTKPVCVLVPFSGGSAADILARILAPKLDEA